MGSYAKLEIGEFYRTNVADGVGRTIEKFKVTPILPRIAVCETAAIAECLARYGDFVWNLAKKLETRAAAETEEAVCEIFQDIWKSAYLFDVEKHDEQSFVALIALRRLFKINDRAKVL